MAQGLNEQEASDEELIGRLASGHRDAIGPLYARYAPLVFNLASRSLEPSFADEVVQEVFLAIWRNADSFNLELGTFRNWALQIAHNRILNELRSRGRRVQLQSGPDGAELANLTDPAPDPAEAAWLAHRREIVRAAVNALPPPQRQALSLAFLDDLTHQQVADALNLPMGTAKTRIRSGLQSLRAHLAPLLLMSTLLFSLLTVSIIRDRLLKSTLVRDEAALRLVTSSDIVPLRLVAAPGTPNETHGNYRSRPGATMAVITFSHLRPPAKGTSYHAWGLFAGNWYSLGTVHPNPDGSELIISEGPHLAQSPTALKLTLESTKQPTTPTGPTVIHWPSP